MVVKFGEETCSTAKCINIQWLGNCFRYGFWDYGYVSYDILPLWTENGGIVLTWEEDLDVFLSNAYVYSLKTNRHGYGEYPNS